MRQVSQSRNGREDGSVLVVNDAPEQLSLMDNLLRKAGYAVLTAEDGLQAFEVAKREQPDIVISDVSMPRVNGIEFCRLLRQDSSLKSVPVLLISGLQKGTKNVIEGLKAGADDYLELPFDSSQLIAKVSRLLERSRLEALYRDLVEHSTDIIFTQDLEGRLTSINAAGAQFLGRTQEELIGASFIDVFQIEPKSAKFLDSVRRLDAGEEFRQQFRAHHFSGSERWLELVVSPIRDKVNKNTIGFRGVARDITERKRFELALLDSEERYRLLFESTPQPILVYDEETLKFLAVNLAATRTYGYSREEFLSMTIEDIYAEEDIPALLIKTSISLDEPVLSSPWRHLRRDKSILYVETTSHPLDFEDRNAQLLIVNDVTERKLLDEKQREMHASLQQSAMEWRQTFNAIDFPVLIVDKHGNIKRLNRAAEDIAGVPADEIVGRFIGEVGAGEPWQKASALVLSANENRASSSVEINDPISGKTWQIALYLIQEFGSFGERAILIAQDITKRAELEASLRQGQMMSLLGSLVAGVAHEVRNPLFGISSILDAFETRFSDRDDYIRYTSVLRDEIGRLTSLMEELLEYGKPFRGDLYVAPVEEVIGKSLRACVPAAEAAQVNLVNGIAGKLPSLRIDRRRLSKVFVNLIENAVQHSPSGGTVTVEVQTISGHGQQWLDCIVRDTGTGIQQEDLPRIFEPFFSRRRGGTGLGLAIAQRIMSEHGGNLIACNNPEGGACMIARFPLPSQDRSQESEVRRSEDRSQESEVRRSQDRSQESEVRR